MRSSQAAQNLLLLGIGTQHRHAAGMGLSAQGIDPAEWTEPATTTDCSWGRSCGGTAQVSRRGIFLLGVSIGEVFIDQVPSTRGREVE